MGIPGPKASFIDGNQRELNQKVRFHLNCQNFARIHPIPWSTAPFYN